MPKPAAFFGVFARVSALVLASGAPGVVADVSSRTVSVATSEEVTKWQPLFDNLVRFKGAIDNLMHCDGFAAESMRKRLYGAVIPPSSDGQTRLIWAVSGTDAEADTFGLGGVALFIDRDGNKIGQFPLAPDQDGGEKKLPVVRVQFAGKVNGVEVTEWYDRELTVNVTTLPGIPEGTASLWIGFFITESDGKKARIDLAVPMPKEAAKRGAE